MLITAFDLSTTCTGVTIARLEDGVLASLKTQAIIPPGFDTTALGYLPTKRQVKPKSGKPFQAWVTKAGEVISKTEQARRNTEVRITMERERIGFMAISIADILRSEPDVVLMEANMAFRSMQVTRQEGEMSGVLQGIAAQYHTKVEKINVHSARSKLCIGTEMVNFARGKNPVWLKSIDLTKETVKYLMLKKYGGKYNLRSDMTTDESDSLLIFDYWYEEVTR